MRTQSRDTHPEAERVLIDLIRKAPVAKRFGLTRSMTASLVGANRRNVQRFHPNVSQIELAQILASLNELPSLAPSIKAVLERKKGWMFHEPDILHVLSSLAKVLEELHIAYYISGSVASSVYGMQQLARDIDMVIELQLARIHPLIHSLQQKYLVEEQAVLSAVQQRRAFGMIHLGTFFKVDVVIPVIGPYEQQIKTRLRRLILDEDERGFPFPSPEDIVLTKLWHHGVHNAITDDQWNDILGVLKVQGPELDLAYLKSWAAYLEISHLLEQACIDAGLIG
jgi:hypothetical protein